MKKLISALLAVAMLFVFAACGTANTGSNSGNKVQSIDEVELTKPAKITAVAKDKLKIGFIYLHDENSTYDKNFIDAAEAVRVKLGLSKDQIISKTNIAEGDECYIAAKELVNAGCNIIFADSFGHEPYMIKAAKEFKDVQFCHATGTRAQTELVPNFHNAFASIYEGRYLAGVAAGLKLNEMIEAGKFKAEEAKIGYVGAFPYAEVISGFTSFYLGAKSVCPTVTMEVKYTNSWFDITAENTTANALIQSGCKLISQHADSSGAPSACEEAGVPNVAYNIDTSNIGPNTALISSKISWEPYFELMLNAMIKGESIPSNWTGTMGTESVVLTKLNEKVAANGTQEKLDEVKAKLVSGEIKVFDTKNFTVGGKELTSYLADVVDNGDFVKDTEVIINGCFAESVKRAAPYFDIIIDGITAPNK